MLTGLCHRLLGFVDTDTETNKDFKNIYTSSLSLESSSGVYLSLSTKTIGYRFSAISQGTYFFLESHTPDLINNLL